MNLFVSFVRSCDAAERTCPPSDIAIIGAGPYGLSATAHLRAIPGLEVRAFGEPMSFWDRNMPHGMLLRSNWSATTIADPHRRLSLDAFREATGNHLGTPVPLDRFVQYGMWYQRQAFPGTRFAEGPAAGVRFRHLSSHLGGRRSGPGPQSGHRGRHRLLRLYPTGIQGLPRNLISQTTEHCDLRNFAGQSALESGALLREGGAEVEIITRSPDIHGLQGSLSKTLHRGLGRVTQRLLYAPTDVGPADISQLVARTHLLQATAPHLTG